jgi:hypothetical protein
VSQSDSAVVGCRVSIGDFELHAGGRQHRSIVTFAPMFVALLDSANAIRVPAFRIFNPSSTILSLVSQTPPAVFDKLKPSPEILFCPACCVVFTTLNTRILAGFRVFSFTTNSNGHLCSH